MSLKSVAYMSQPEIESDYIVVGGGSSGSIVAARLAEAGHTVTLIEAGPRDRNPWIHVPLGFGKLFDMPGIIWPYEVAGGDALENRRIAQPRGRVLGGTGSINGMTYIRGEPAIYDRWATAGATGWSYEDVLPFFKKAEGNRVFSSAAHSSSGPIQISCPPPHPLMDGFVASAEALGFHQNDDFNEGSAEGVGYFQFTYADGRRSSSARAYLYPGRPNLQIVTGASVERILFNGKRATAVRVDCHKGPRIFCAKAEIVICAGTFATPQLLQLSGIGPGELLQSYGIETLADLQGVGGNYQDHFESRVVTECNRVITLNDIYNSLPRRLLMGLQYILARKGPMATGGVLGGGFFKLDPVADTVDCQVNFGIWSTSRGLGDPKAPLLDSFPAFRLTVVDLAPEARGRVEIRSPFSIDAPAIIAPFLETSRDREAIVRCMKLARTIVAAEPLASFATREVVPGPGFENDDALFAYAQRFGRPNFHAVGTCRMGRGRDAVVGPDLRVCGIDGLRIADASVMPIIPNGNTNAACTMIAEKASAVILGA